MKKNFLLIKTTLCCLAAVLVMQSCTKKFEEYNTNPNNATDEMMEFDFLSTGVYFPQMQQNIFPVAQQPNFGDEMYQIVQNLAGDVYSGYMGASNNWFGNANNTTYAMIPNWYNAAFGRSFLSVMPAWLAIKKKSEFANPHVYALAQILKAMSLHRTTDMYGPLPLTNFGKGGLTTTYDSQEVIYDSLFNALNYGISTLTEYVTLYPGQRPMQKYDLVYGGDYVKWIKFANSLKLRLAMRIVDANPGKARQYAEEAVSHPIGVITDNADNAMLSSGNGVNFNNPLYIICFNFDDIRMGANMESFLKGYNDPRADFMFNKAPDGQFHGIRNGITIANKAAYTAPFSTLNISANTPVRWMSAAEIWFLRSEGAMRGWNMNGTAQQLYEQGITTSFAQWGASNAAAYINNSTSLPAAYTDVAAPGTGNNIAANSTALSNITIQWQETASNAVKLERIQTQKWIAVYPDGQEAWSEFRRTTYPKIFPVVLNQSGGLIAAPAQIKRLPFPQTEYQSNAAGVVTGVAALGGADNIATSLWWDRTP
ncbi:MAG: SusD/RagB family nutrient-binding outer membrane lipoprotein [Chitinophagaceae bacterium]|nr:SusD/RagB family nutrient-binding outer membrane lipoprotein [Chitinophagaceae bacterium]